MSSGYTIGSSDSPTAQLNIVSSNATSGTWNLRVQLNRSYAVDEANDRQFVHSILMPTKVACDIDLASAMTGATLVSVLYQDIDNKWAVITDRKLVDAQINFSDTPLTSVMYGGAAVAAPSALGCFTVIQFEVDISDGQTNVMCDLILCFSGTYALSGCRSFVGCDKFPLYVSDVTARDSPNTYAAEDDQFTTVAPPAPPGGPDDGDGPA
jgi:hypothetical protein